MYLRLAKCSDRPTNQQTDMKVHREVTLPPAPPPLFIHLKIDATAQRSRILQFECEYNKLAVKEWGGDLRG